MPTNAQNLSPLDLNKNISIGVGFPLMDDGRFDPTFTVKEQVKSNILNVLLTEPGERLNLPDFGVGIRSLLGNKKSQVESTLSTYGLNTVKHLNTKITIYYQTTFHIQLFLTILKNQ